MSTTPPLNIDSHHFSPLPQLQLPESKPAIQPACESNLLTTLLKTPEIPMCSWIKTKLIKLVLHILAPPHVSNFTSCHLFLRAPQWSWASSLSILSPITGTLPLLLEHFARPFTDRLLLNTPLPLPHSKWPISPPATSEPASQFWVPRSAILSSLSETVFCTYFLVCSVPLCNKK